MKTACGGSDKKDEAAALSTISLRLEMYGHEIPLPKLYILKAGGQ